MNMQRMFQLVFLLCAQINDALGQKRLIWNISHMINKVSDIKKELSRGANAIEADVRFNSKCEVKAMYHGFPCDCIRYCWDSTPAAEYLQGIKEMITMGHKNYNPDLTMVMLDMKISDLNAECKYEAGRSMAENILNYLYRPNDTYFLNMVMSLSYVEDRWFIEGFIMVMSKSQSNFYEELTRYIAWDFSRSQSLSKVSQTFDSLNITRGRWLGDGITNCLPASFGRLYAAISWRDSETGYYFDKVYFWTVDKKSTIRTALRLGVDALVTNYPKRVIEVLNEEEFRGSYTLAHRTSVITDKYQKEL